MVFSIHESLHFKETPLPYSFKKQIKETFRDISFFLAIDIFGTV